MDLLLEVVASLTFPTRAPLLRIACGGVDSFSQLEKLYPQSLESFDGFLHGLGLVDARDEELEVFLTFSAVFGELFG